MRINRLDLTRYGHFTDMSLAFPAPAKGVPDLHVVYGPNEAGKSTLFSAWLDLLYGIEPRSAYNFLHPYASMRIGASLTTGSGALDLVRVKTQTNSLLDGSARPLPDGIITAALGGLGRDDYRMMFSLDEKTVEKGGESILSSQGDFGRLLFSASSGLAGLVPLLEALRSEADKFHKSGGRTGRLRDLKIELDALTEERRRLDVAAGDHARLVEAEKAAALAHHAAERVLAETSVHLASTRRLLDAVPKFARLRIAEAELAALPDLPSVPAGWAEAFPRLALEDAGTAARIDETTKALSDTEAALANLQPDPQGVALVPGLEAAAPLKSLHETAVADLPKRREELAGADRSISALLQKLGQADADPRKLLLGQAATTSLRAHLAERSGLAERLRMAQGEVHAARQAFADAQERRGSDAPTDVDIDTLSALLTRLRSQDPHQALRHARETAAASETALSARLAALAPWRGSGEDVAALPVPHRDQLDSLEARVTAADRVLQTAKTEQARLKASVERHAVAFDATTQDPLAVTTPDADRLRSQREALWSEHRKHLTHDTATAFEAAMRADDRATARLAEQGANARIAEQAKATFAADKAALHSADNAVTTALAESEAARADLQQAIFSISASLPQTFTASALRDWLMLRSLAVEAQTAHIAATASLTLAVAELAEARHALMALFNQPDEAQPFEVLIARAEVLVAKAAEENAARQTATALARRDEALAEALAADARWIGTWSGLVGQTWLGATANPTAVPGILDLLDQLDRLVATRDALAHRIDTMEANRARFAQSMADLSPEGAEAGVAPQETWSRLTVRVTQAQAIHSERDRLQGNLVSLAEKREAFRIHHLRIASQLSEMEMYFGVSGVTSLTTALAQSTHRSDLARTCADSLRDLAETLGLIDPVKARSTLEALDPEALEREAATLAEAHARQQTELQQAYATLSAARQDLAAIGGDDAVARIETRRQALLLVIATEAEAHLRTRFGLIATEQALRTYRESHRSAMLDRAARAFSTISQGAYTGLATQPDKDREQLVALSAGGSSKLAQDLSKGTRFQLYLALRVAGYFEYAQTRATVPFVADDIMESFDDGRAAQAFTVLSDMAQIGQVIYLTHHEHLYDIAQAHCPGVHLHRLG